MNNIEKTFEESVQLKKEILNGDQLPSISRMGDVIAQSIAQGKKLLICGNGGSAADAQHLAAELLVRLRPSKNRRAIPAIALAMDPSTITATGNDFSFEALFERMVQALGAPGDVLLGISTSGNSENVIRACVAAKEKGMQVFAFNGAGGGKLKDHVDDQFLVPSSITGRVQEAHITAGHALMEYVEDKLFESGYLVEGEY